VHQRRRVRVALDIRVVQQALRNSPDGGMGGPSRYAYELLRGFLGHDEIDHLLLVDDGPLPRRLSELVDRCRHFSLWRVGIVGMPRRFSYGRAAALTGRIESPLISHQIARLKPTLVHIMDQPPPRLSLRPRLVTAHDPGPLHETMQASECWPLRSLAASRVKDMSSADVIVCDSQATRDDVARLLDLDRKRLVVVYPGVDTKLFSPGPPRIMPAELGLPPRSRYFLHVGVLRERKNPRGLLKAYREIAIRTDNVHLLCVGPYQTSPQAAHEVSALAEELRLDGRVHLVGNVTDAKLVELYRGSVGLVFPSLFEGFGFPVAEALACGVPCVTSSNSSLPEVGGAIAIYVDPRDEHSIATGMTRLLEDVQLRQRVAVAGPAWTSRFSWSVAAEALRNLYHAHDRQG
jgi:glycosyltransferase involved in cell wall biosynthesis